MRMKSGLKHEVLDPRKNIFARRLNRAIFQLINLRPVYAQHTEKEEKLLSKYAEKRKVIVELGVAEGASAVVLSKVAGPSARVFLIDPYLPGRIPGLNFNKLVAHRYLRKYGENNVTWVQKFSTDAVKGWSEKIDFLFIDADHSYKGCVQDWIDWTPLVRPDGVVALHDARVFEQGWTRPDWGPVRLVEEIKSGSRGREWSVVDSADSVVIIQRTP